MTGGEGPQDNSGVTKPDRSGPHTGPLTGRSTGRRLRSAFSLWRSAVSGTDILVAGVFAALSLGLGAYVYARGDAAAHVEFTQQAQQLQAAVAESLLMPGEDLTALKSFLVASGGETTRRQFRLLVNPMLARHRGVYAFEWLPVVRHSERSLFEAEARDAGLAGYRFWEVGPDGKPREAALRPSYVPIHYMEPPSALALGFDIAADSMRWTTAEKARDSGDIAASLPFTLIEDAGKPDSPPVVAMYAAVYKEGDPGVDQARRASLAGLAMAIFRVAPLVNTAAATHASDLGYSLKDLEAREAPILAERPKGASALPRRAGFQLAFPVNFSDRRWSLSVFALPGSFLPEKRGAIAAAVAGLIAVLLGLVTVTSIRTILRLRRQVEKVGPYSLVARLGNGAMGVVWEARHALLRRPTAVKLLAPGTSGERALARFEREVQLTAGLTHPSTIAIYDYGRTGEGVFYYAMELLRGINLLQLVEFDGPLPPARVVHLLRQACGALTEAHAAGLIHRDIKPANLMICVYGGIPDFLKVLDFGLVKDIGVVERPREGAPRDGVSDVSLSQDGSLLGTPLYMAPEGMSDPSHVDVRADLFALGAVGYFLLTGHSPFPGRTAIEVFRMERQGPPPPLSRAAPAPVPPSLENIINHCLAFRRDDRPCSAEELGAMLEACVIEPPWKTEHARAWWRDRGPAALAAVRAQREERSGVLRLASDPASST